MARRNNGHKSPDSYQFETYEKGIEELGSLGLVPDYEGFLYTRMVSSRWYENLRRGENGILPVAILYRNGTLRLVNRHIFYNGIKTVETIEEYHSIIRKNFEMPEPKDGIFMQLL